MAGAGVDGASDRVVREPFEAWPAAHTTPIRGTSHDAEPGIVLLWRNAEGLVDHAAVTIGDGNTFNKPSQAWCSPRLVWTVRETIAANRVTGLHLTRHRLSPHSA